MLAETEVQAQIALRNVASAAAHLVGLNQIAGGDANASVEGEAIAFDAVQGEADEVIMFAAFGSENHRRAFEILDD